MKHTGNILKEMYLDSRCERYRLDWV